MQIYILAEFVLNSFITIYLNAVIQEVRLSY